VTDKRKTWGITQSITVLFCIVVLYCIIETHFKEVYNDFFCIEIGR
jgi:hypothetical protein